MAAGQPLTREGFHSRLKQRGAACAIKIIPLHETLSFGTSQYLLCSALSPYMLASQRQEDRNPSGLGRDFLYHRLCTRSDNLLHQRSHSFILPGTIGVAGKVDSFTVLVLKQLRCVKHFAKRSWLPGLYFISPCKLLSGP